MATPEVRLSDWSSVWTGTSVNSSEATEGLLLFVGLLWKGAGSWLPYFLENF